MNYRNTPNLKTAISLWQTERFFEARQMLEWLVKTTPNDERTWLWLARARTDSERRHHALLRVLQINPHNEVAQRVLREEFGEERSNSPDRITWLLQNAASADWWLAECRYQEILEIDPAHPDALNILLTRYIDNYQWHRAFNLLEDCRTRLPENLDLARRQLDLVLERGDLDVLERLLETLLNHPAAHVEDLRSAGKLLMEDHRYKPAVTLFEEATQRDPEHQQTHYDLVKSYQALGQTENVREAVKGIADADYLSEIGEDAVTWLLERDPHVPLGIRRKSSLAVREAVGITLPVILLAVLDNRLNLFGIDRVIGAALAFLGGYLLVTAISSHEQALWQWFMPDGLSRITRGMIGLAGTWLLVIAIFLALRTSVSHSTELAVWEERACQEIVTLIGGRVDLDKNLPPCQSLGISE